ncbi:MAG TPA: LacI family DNA-binding transcriptional regulator [Chthoniobacterales bacterium]
MSNLKEVAELAGVSIATASLALRGGGNLRESTRKRVITCAKRLSYTPNQIGRTLNTGKAHAIALLMMTSASSADIVRGTALFYHLVRGALAVVDEAKYALRLDVKSHEDPDLMQYFDQVVGGHSLDGIVIAPQFVRNYAFIHTLEQNGFPYVLMRPASFGRDVNYVDLQSDYGGQLVAELFAKQGRRRVAMINGPAQHVDAIEREKGFMEGLAGAGLDRLTKRYGDFTIPSGISAMKDILQEFTPDAVFCANDYMAAGAMKVLAQAKLRVPEDVAMVGYDNTDICIGLTPALTTVDYRAEEVGRCLAGELLALIEGKVSSVQKAIRPFLVERESHGPNGKPGP